MKITKVILSRVRHSYGLKRIGSALDYNLTMLGRRKAFTMACANGSVKTNLTRVYEFIGEPKYLEIEPTMLWVYPDFDSTNDVFSNTNWRIN